MDSKKGRETLLRNIKNTTIDENQIIAPVQVDSNCWFNTMFVVFFFSDKGRKFFRYFREMMITGKHANGDKIKPRLAKSLLILNACIEASYGNKNIALAMDTNTVIFNIWRSIPKTQRYKSNGKDWIRDTNQGGNPWGYYRAIMKFIDNKDLKYARYDKKIYKKIINMSVKTDTLYDMLVFDIHSEEDKNIVYQNELKLPQKSGGVIRYKLDAYQLCVTLEIDIFAH